MDNRLEDAKLAEKNPVCIDQWRIMIALAILCSSDDVFYNYTLLKSMFHRIADSPQFLRTVFWYEMLLCFCRVLLESSILLGILTSQFVITNSHSESVVSNNYLIAECSRRSPLKFCVLRSEISRFSIIDPISCITLLAWYDIDAHVHYRINSDYRRSFNDGLHNLDTCAWM